MRRILSYCGVFLVVTLLIELVFYFGWSQPVPQLFSSSPNPTPLSPSVPPAVTGALPPPPLSSSTSPKQCIVFWHVKKTGDTVVGHAKAQRALELLENDKAGQRALKENHQACFWLVSVRDPVERFISKFYFRQAFDPKAQAWGPSIDDFVRTDPVVLRRFPLVKTKKELARLLQVLEEEIDAVMVTERFDESLLVLEEEGVVSRATISNYTNYGVTLGRPKKDALEPDVREKIEQVLALDIMFYEAAKNKLERSIERFGRQRMEARLEEMRKQRAERPLSCAEKEELEGIKAASGCRNFTVIQQRVQQSAQERG